MINRRWMIPLITVFAFITACNSDDDGPTVNRSVKGGDFIRLAAGSVYSEFAGYAQLIVTNKSSSVEVHVLGLTPNMQYNSHVHNDWCSSEPPGGGHYLQNKDGPDIALNGLWPTITVDANGKGVGKASQNFVVTSDAKSVVIHESGQSDRIACVNLYSTQGMRGTFSITDAGTELYEAITGKAFISVNDNGTSKAELGITGLTANRSYKAHVHDGDCASGGGGHYLQDLEGEDVASNGLWPGAKVDAFGYATGLASNLFKVRLAETKSIVVHDADDASIRVACADFDTDLLAFRSGQFSATSKGEALYNAIEGRAELSITTEGISSVAVYVSGLMMNSEYKAHVHNGTCESGGGGHYLQDMAGEDVASNGLWPIFTTGTNGVGMIEVSNNFIVRPDARSVVIHEPGVSDRIACTDLL